MIVVAKKYLCCNMFYMLMFSCHWSTSEVRKLKHVVYFYFITSDSIQCKVVFECMVFSQNGFSFTDLTLSSNGF